MKKRGTKRAFTLIELLIVVAIIAIVSAIIIVSIRNSQSHASDAQRAADLAKINSAVQIYYRENGSYPAKLNVLAAVPTDPGPGIYQYLTNISVTGKIECYKILVTKPENPATVQYKSIWDPARDGGSDQNKVDGTNPTAWSDYSRGCEAK